MDNLTHSLFGWTLARAGLDRHGKWVTPFLILTANLPDVEPVLIPGTSRGRYLLEHRGITHGVPMLALYALVFGVFLWRLERRGKDTASLRFVTAVGICSAGLFSHLLLDALNTYGVRPAMPFDATWYYGDMLFIVDPWAWLILATAIFAATELDLRRGIRWSVAATVTTVILLRAIGSGLVPWQAAMAWSAVIAAAIVLRFKSKATPARSARTGLFVLAMYLAFVFVASRAALERGKAVYESALAHSNVQWTKTSVRPVPALPWRYDVLLQNESTLALVSIDFLGHDSMPDPFVNLNLNDPLLEKVRGTFEYKAWRAFARHPYVLRKGNALILGDVRFGDPGSDWARQTVEIPNDK